MNHIDYKKEQDMLCAMVVMLEDIPFWATGIPRNDTQGRTRLLQHHLTAINENE
jgi:hypothetical protein